MPTTEATMIRCQAIQRGVIRNRHREASGEPGMVPSLIGLRGASRPVAAPARESLPRPAGTLRDNRSMSLTDLLLLGRSGLAGRLPTSLDELHGPEQGVIVLPRHLAWPGMREFDLSDDRLRRSLYGIVLTQGRRNDMARFVNGLGGRIEF